MRVIEKTGTLFTETFFNIIIGTLRQKGIDHLVLI